MISIIKKISFILFLFFIFFGCTQVENDINDDIIIKEKPLPNLENYSNPDDLKCNFGNYGWNCDLNFIQIGVNQDINFKELDLVKEPYEDFCLEQGGNFRSSGLMPDFVSCIFPLNDYGQSCQVSNDCQGYCTVSDEFVKEYLSDLEFNKSKEIYGDSFCSEFPRGIGQFYVYENGKVTREVILE